MENKKPVSDDSDVIMIDNPPETITITESSPEKRKKIKPKKQCKRKVQLGLNHNNDTETLLITQKVQMKRKKFRCIINIDSVCKKPKRSDSIIRYSKNECNILADYDRIVPICLRNDCFHVKVNELSKSCCKSDQKKGNLDSSPPKRNGIYSPISPAVDQNDISYEDVSSGDLDSSFEDEMDTLIKRTKEREKQSFRTLKTVLPLYTSSPLHTNEGIASPYSSASVHSKATLVFTPEIDAYSPKLSPTYTQDDNPYPEATPDSKEMEEPGKSELHVYSPTDPTVTPPRLDYIGAFDQNCTKKEDSSCTKKEHNYNIDAYSFKLSPTYTQDDYQCPEATPEREMEGPGKDELHVYSPADPTVTPHRFDFIGAFDQNCTRKEDSRPNPPMIKLEQDNGNKSGLSQSVKTEIKTEIVEITNSNSLNNTEQIFVKRENGGDVNANFEVNIKTEKRY